MLIEVGEYHDHAFAGCLKAGFVVFGNEHGFLVID